ncbi:Uncharacterised protein [Mycobacteroides abscessus subsp. abscessus]|nr:Uncharacterised protein [Mycobacteroides abscessus subsp. abscessus]
MRVPVPSRTSATCALKGEGVTWRIGCQCSPAGSEPAATFIGAGRWYHGGGTSETVSATAAATATAPT